MCLKVAAFIIADILGPIARSAIMNAEKFHVELDAFIKKRLDVLPADVPIPAGKQKIPEIATAFPASKDPSWFKTAWIGILIILLLQTFLLLRLVTAIDRLSERFSSGNVMQG
jgi:hypothetical protein